MYDTIIVGGGSARLVPGPQALRQKRQQKSCSARRVRTPHPARSRRKFATAIRAPPISIRASTGPISRSRPRSSATTTRKPIGRRCASTSGRAYWAAAPPSTARWPTGEAPTDYDDWEARGAAGWGWKDVLPYFRKVERDLDFDGPFHGKEGRIPVRRIPQAHWDSARAGRWRGLQARRIQFPARPERRVRRRLFSGDALQCRRAAGLGRDGLSGCRNAQTHQSDDLKADPQVKELMFEGTRCVGGKGGGRWPGTGIPRPRGGAVVRRDPLAGASVARRHRARSNT